MYINTKIRYVCIYLYTCTVLNLGKLAWVTSKYIYICAHIYIYIHIYIYV